MVPALEQIEAGVLAPQLSWIHAGVWGGHLIHKFVAGVGKIPSPLEE